MGLKCSVFGHDYADYDVERDRADHGGEVVTTVRTTEICRKCGDARIVSENTEIAAASAAAATTDSSRPGDDGDGSGDTADRDIESSEGISSRSGTSEFEFDGTAGADRDARISEDRSVGPTTAYATSQSLAESELRCGACDFAEPMLGSPLRAGDSCPRCSRGYLARRTRKE